MKRNQTLVKQVLRRDLGICRCCGFEASEVHHIIPISSGGEDKFNNMISLCWTCHTHAPDTKQEFYQYLLGGGARTFLLLGKVVDFCFRAESESNGIIKSNEMISLSRKLILCLKETAYNLALENYNLKDSLNIEDVDFSDFKFKKLTQNA